MNKRFLPEWSLIEIPVSVYPSTFYSRKPETLHVQDAYGISRFLLAGDVLRICRVKFLPVYSVPAAGGLKIRNVVVSIPELFTTNHSPLWSFPLTMRSQRVTRTILQPTAVTLSTSGACSQHIAPSRAITIRSHDATMKRVIQRTSNREP